MHQDIVNFKVTIMYDGSNFFGSARQKNHRTVQNTIETILSNRLDEKITIVNCSRTDRNVHSLKFVFNFKTKRKITNEKLNKLLSKMLPSDIQLLSTEIVSNDFHARFSAKYKVYHYQLAKQRPNVFDNRYFGYVNDIALNLDVIKQASACLIGEHDFMSFSAYNRTIKHTICHIFDIIINETNTTYYFTVIGHRFLKQMVRIIIANLILVGQGQLTVSQFEKILLAKQRHLSSAIVSGNGLYLEDVIY